MRRFLLKTAIALCIALCFHLIAAWHADGSSDAYYLRFTGHRHASLIIGTSRGAQGIDPTAFAEGKKGDGWAPDLFNFAFTRANSPYGPTYLRAIAGKLDPGQDNGLFLVSVDPWALSERKDENGFPESERFLGRMHTFNSTPNPEYLIRCYGAGWGALLGGPLVGADTTLFLHEDGWLEVRIPMDSASVATRSAQKKREYARLAEEFNFRP
ncbi:MAG: hypothetical protein KDB84_12155, partial [Flavobacteriales bacterium]|nr:hypothetical protein [Flavobacteriales bacterium]